MQSDVKKSWPVRVMVAAMFLGFWLLVLFWGSRRWWIALWAVALVVGVVLVGWCLRRGCRGLRNQIRTAYFRVLLGATRQLH